MRPAQLTNQSLDLARQRRWMATGSTGPVLQADKAVGLIAAKPGVDRLARHPIPLSDLYDRRPSDNLHHGPIPLLDHAQLPHTRECQASIRADL
jgi:hypothetical protein